MYCGQYIDIKFKTCGITITKNYLIFLFLYCTEAECIHLKLKKFHQDHNIHIQIYCEIC